MWGGKRRWFGAEPGRILLGWISRVLGTQRSSPVSLAGQGTVAQEDIGANERGWLGAQWGLYREERFSFPASKEGCGEQGLVPA